MSDPYVWRDPWAEIERADAVLAHERRQLRLEGQALSFLRRARGHTLSPAQQAKADRYPCPSDPLTGRPLPPEEWA